MTATMVVETKTLSLTNLEIRIGLTPLFLLSNLTPVQAQTKPIRKKEL